jgi:hypothetical protein
MFSRKERDFLELLERARHGDRSADEDLEAAFPSAAYRRKLLWGIRRKAALASDDWELYARVAEVESRVLPRPPTGPKVPILVAEDPLVRVLRQARRALRRPPKGSTTVRPPDPRVHGGGRP